MIFFNLTTEADTSSNPVASRDALIGSIWW